MAISSARAPRLLLTLSLFGLALPATAADNGEQWEITAKVEMPGMPVSMPAMTHKVCLPKQQQRPVEDMLPKEGNSDCKMDDIRHSGTKTTFKMHCTGKHAMTGSGEIVNDGDSYHGTMHVVSSAGAQPIDMTQTFSGRRIGTCAR